ncbi:MAG: hypothetical protein IJ125_06000 [Atopobiaceae bacterium]|nr:hypothetical protein [Atopobiaceae bacterium]
MKRIVNEYDYTAEIAREAQLAYIKDNMGTLYERIALPVVALAGIGLSIYLKNPTYLVLTLGVVVVTLVSYLVSRQNAQAEMERLGLIGESASVRTTCVLDSSLQFYRSGDSNRGQIGLERIEGHSVTEHLVVVFVKGGIFIPFDKQGFTKGSTEQLLARLEQIERTEVAKPAQAQSKSFVGKFLGSSKH